MPINFMCTPLPQPKENWLPYPNNQLLISKGGWLQCYMQLLNIVLRSHIYTYFMYYYVQTYIYTLDAFNRYFAPQLYTLVHVSWRGRCHIIPPSFGQSFVRPPSLGRERGGTNSTPPNQDEQGEGWARNTKLTRWLCTPTKTITTFYESVDANNHQT